MQVVVADATPLHYLILIETIEILPRIFEKIHVPIEARNELSCEGAPPVVRTWMERPPSWLEVIGTADVHSEDSSSRPGLRRTGSDCPRGIHRRRPPINLLIDDRAGAILAQQHGFAVTGTLGVLDLAFRAGLLQLRDSFARLQKTNFRYPPSLMKTLLEEEKKRKT